MSEEDRKRQGAKQASYRETLSWSQASKKGKDRKQIGRYKEPSEQNRERQGTGKIIGRDKKSSKQDRKRQGTKQAR